MQLQTLISNYPAKVTFAVILFCIGVIFKDFFLVKSLFLYTDIGGDSLYGEWPILAFINENLQNGTLSFWTHSFGLGANILTLNHYLFDPFNWILYFGNTKTMTLLIPYVFSLKILAAAAFFYGYLTRFKLNTYAVSICSVLFAFCGYTVIWGRFLPFGTAVVYLAMVLFAFEIWFTSGKKRWLVASLFLLALFSHYFLFFITLFLGVYAIVRKASYGKGNLSSWSGYIGTLTFCYLMALGLSAPILLPSVYVTLASPRIGGEITSLFALNSVEYYLALVSRFFSNHASFAWHKYFYEWLNYYETPNVYCGLLPLLLLPQLFRQAKRIEWADVALLGFIGLLLILPFFADALNLFSYRQYRWTFIVSPVILFLTAKVLNGIERDSVLNRKVLLTSFFVLCTILTSAAFLANNRVGPHADFIEILRLNSEIYILLAFYTVLLFCYPVLRIRSFVKVGIFSVVLFEIIQHSHFDIVANRSLVSPEYISNHGFFDDTRAAIEKIKSQDQGFYRVSKGYLSGSWGDPAAQGYMGTTSYLSVNSPGYLSFLETFSNEYPNKNVVKLPVDRLELNTLVGIKYHLSRIEGDKPYGYELLAKVGTVYIYKNSFALPLAVFYDSYLTGETFKKLPRERQDVEVLNNFVDFSETKPPSEFTEKFPDAALSVIQKPSAVAVLGEIQTANLQILENKFPALLSFQAKAINPIIYFSMADSNQGIYEIEYELTSPVKTFGQIFWKNEVEGFTESKSKYFQIEKGNNKFKHNFGNTRISQFRMDISAAKDEFELSGVKTTFVPILFDSESYRKNVLNLRRSMFEVTRFDNFAIEGRVNAPSKGLLAISIPFDTGWKVYVDGQLRAARSVNGGLTGVPIDPGISSVRLTFIPKMLMEGLLIFLIVIAVTLIICRRSLINGVSRK